MTVSRLSRTLFLRSKKQERRSRKEDFSFFEKEKVSPTSLSRVQPSCSCCMWSVFYAVTRHILSLNETHAPCITAHIVTSKKQCHTNRSGATSVHLLSRCYQIFQLKKSRVVFRTVDNIEQRDTNKIGIKLKESFKWLVTASQW